MDFLGSKILEEFMISKVIELSKNDEVDAAIDLILDYSHRINIKFVDVLLRVAINNIEDLEIPILLCLLCISKLPCKDLYWREDFILSVRKELRRRGESEKRIRKLVDGFKCKDK